MPEEEKTQDQNEQKTEDTPVEGTQLDAPPETPQPEPAVENTQPDVPTITPEAVTVQQQPLTINVDLGTKINMTAIEYDKRITEAELVVAELKKQKANYIYETNVQLLIASAQQHNNSKQ